VQHCSRAVCDVRLFGLSHFPCLPPAAGSHSYLVAQAPSNATLRAEGPKG
jgi:hypothetical protein